MDLRKQKEKVQSRETNQQAKLHNLDEINKLVELHKYGLVDFDEQLVRRLVEKSPSSNATWNSRSKMVK
ncbi:hypothetical protein [Limosilactobacillus reuteri]